MTSVSPITNSTDANYNAVKIKINDPKTTIPEGFKSADLGNYNAINIEVNRPTIDVVKMEEIPAEVAVATFMPIELPVIPVDPVLIATVVPEYVRPAINTPDQQLVQNEIATTEKDVMEVPEVVVNSIESPDGTIESFATNPTKIMLFFSPHCGYCKDFMKPNGVWQKVKRVVRDYVDIVEINSDVNPQMLREFNVSYFPCLMKVKDNNVYEFTDARTFENVEKFCLN